MSARPTREQLVERIEKLEALVRRSEDVDAELRASEAKYRALFESGQDAILLVDEGGRITDCNSRATLLINRERSELIGALAEEIIIDDPSEDAFRLGGSGDRLLTEGWVRPGDGGEVPVTISYSQVGIPGQVNIQILRDMSEQRRMLERVRESEQKFRSIVDNIAIGVALISPKMEILQLNRQMREWFPDIDVAQQPICFKAFNDPPGTEICDYCPTCWSLRDGQVHESVTDTPTGNGVRNYRILASPIKDKHGEIVAAIEMVDDITVESRAKEALQQAKDAAEQANRAKSIFLATMSHEIRTPLNSVIGFTEMLLDTDLDETQAICAGTIVKSSGVLLSLIDDILDFSKIESGDLALEEFEFDPHAVAFEVCDRIMPQVAGRPIELLCHVDASVPRRLRGDPTRVGQVLVNLLNNAAKFTETGEIELTVDAEADKDVASLRMQVRDTGIGIGSDRFDSIFSPFEQGDSSMTRRFGGSGLGLSISRHIAQMMEGDVQVQSAVGEGSAFIFTAHIALAAGPEPQSPVSLPYRILTVVEHDIARERLRQQLVEVGCKVVALTGAAKVDAVAACVEEAQVSGQRFDACLIDARWSGACDVGKAVADLPQPPKMLGLALADKETQRRCAEHGFVALVNKPVRPSRLYEQLQRALGASDKPKRRRKQRPPSGGVRILLAEDNLVNQRLVVMMLTKEGYEIEVAQSGREAVDAFLQTPDGFDLIFMDVQMPEMDGRAATSAIRQEGHQVPIVAMTALAMKGDREACLEAGMNDYVTKPISRNVVVNMIDKWVSSAKS